MRHTLSFAIALSLVIPAVANAHPALKAMKPAANAVMSTAPRELRLTFSEAVIPAFSGVKLTDQSGKAVPTGVAQLDTKDKKQLVVPLKSTLAAGKYQVAWYAVANDTHRVQGKTTFTVKR